MTENKPLLSVIVPAYNEGARIKENVHHIDDYLKGQNFSYEIIVVDDGSSDRTLLRLKELAEELKLRIFTGPQNKGKGYAVRKGMLESKGEYCLFTDADLSAPIEEMEKLLNWLGKGYEVTIGSRGLRQSNIEVHQAWYRERMGRIFNLFVQALALPGIKDSQCGFKCFKGEVARELFRRQRINGFSFDVETLVLSRRYGYKVKEVPIRWANRPASTVHPVKHSLQMLFDLMKLKMLH